MLGNSRLLALLAFMESTRALALFLPDVLAILALCEELLAARPADAPLALPEEPSLLRCLRIVRTSLADPASNRRRNRDLSPDRAMRVGDSLIEIWFGPGLHARFCFFEMQATCRRRRLSLRTIKRKYDRFKVRNVVRYSNDDKPCIALCKLCVAPYGVRKWRKRGDIWHI